jgi:hypothetical protein
MATRQALLPMTRALLFGPGEFLVSRLAVVPSPLFPALFGLWLATCAYAAYRLRTRPAGGPAISAICMVVICLFILAADQATIDKLVFYAPVMIIIAGLLSLFLGKKVQTTDRRARALVTVFAWAAFMESFPRFAREQAVAAMPFVILLLFYLIYLYKPMLSSLFLSPAVRQAAMILLPVVMLLMGGRLFYTTYFDGGLRFRSASELAFERGRGVYFPATEAEEMDRVVSYIRQNTPPDGYFFPQSYVGSSYLFLADRNNPSGAQFWGGVGVTDDERASTLKAIDEKRVALIVTSEKDIAAEKYAPMRDYIAGSFEHAERFGDVLILKRRNSVKGSN